VRLRRLKCSRKQEMLVSKTRLQFGLLLPTRKVLVVSVFFTQGP